MAKNPKIVLLKEGVDAFDYAEKTDSVDIVDAVRVMQTDFVPKQDAALVNQEGGFVVREMSETDAKKIASSDQVEAVIEDEWVYAVAPTATATRARTRSQKKTKVTNGQVAKTSFPNGFALDHDPDEVEALRQEIEFDVDDRSSQLSDEMLRLLCTIDSEGDVDYNLELQLNEQLTGTRSSASVFSDYPYDRADIGSLTERVVRSLLDRQNGHIEVTEADIRSTIERLGVDAPVRIAADAVLPNIRMINAPPVWPYTQGATAKVAVVDTGIDPMHPDLRVAGGVSFVPGVASWRDDHSHGTHVAGIIGGLRNNIGIVGSAPAVNLYAVKVLNSSGQGRLSWILNGLTWCGQNAMHVINLSLGSAFGNHDPRQFNLAYERLGRRLRTRGILCVAAAGNDNHRPVGNPARCPSFMAVSAIDYRRRLTTFTNVGPQVEVCGPGYEILSTVPGGYRRMSGTSMAAPHVTGVAALLKSRFPALHGDSIRVRLMRSAIDLGRPGRDWAFGYGLINAFRALQRAIC